jgi:hypothetical protein
MSGAEGEARPEMSTRRVSAVALVTAGLVIASYGFVAPGTVRPPMSTLRQDGGSKPSQVPRALAGSNASTVVRAVRPPVAATAGLAGGPSAPLARSAPVSIDVPALSISSDLGPARGIDQSGAVDDAPLSGPIWSLPWWYDEGSSPGQEGSAVILGHVDSAIGTGGLGVFFRLGDVRTGEGIDVGLADGSITHWVVTSKQLYDDAAFPDALVYSVSGHPTLRLVTCGGSFDWQTHLYQSALVVTARLMSTS